jgi:hypothetical protein
MKTRGLSDLLFLLMLTFLPYGCARETYDVPDPEREVFNFMVSEAQRQRINESRGERYEITDPVPDLQFAGDMYPVDRFEIRGDNTVNFTRKGFGVNLGRKLSFHNPIEPAERKYEEFKLLAMVYDYTYIENSTAAELFREVGLWPVYSFFTEVKLNGHTQGLYHFIEDPVEYFIEQKNAAFVVRRGYDHVVKGFFMNPDFQQNEEKYYNLLDMIYSMLPEYSGRQLYDTLSAYIDMEQYFTKLSIDLLVKNGDYTDEVFFFSTVRDDREVLGVFPWDYDDIFADQPHEIGNDWAPGTVFGHRAYFSMDDIVADVGSKLLYSIEDDLDYKIAKDSLIYQQYLKTLRAVIEKIDAAAIDKVFDHTYDHIAPFYSNDSIVKQSRYDVDETDYDLFVTNLGEKREMMKERRAWIIQELDKQQNR